MRMYKCRNRAFAKREQCPYTFVLNRRSCYEIINQRKKMILPSRIIMNHLREILILRSPVSIT